MEAVGQRRRERERRDGPRREVGAVEHEEARRRRRRVVGEAQQPHVRVRRPVDLGHDDELLAERAAARRVPGHGRLGAGDVEARVALGRRREARAVAERREDVARARRPRVVVRVLDAHV